MSLDEQRKKGIGPSIKFVLPSILLLVMAVVSLIGGFVSVFGIDRDTSPIQIEALTFSQIANFEEGNNDVAVDCFVPIGEYATLTRNYMKQYYILIMVEDVSEKEYLMSIRVSNKERASIVTYVDDPLNMTTNFHVQGALHELSGKEQMHFFTTVSSLDLFDEIPFTFKYILSEETYKMGLVGGIFMFVMGTVWLIAAIFLMRHFFKVLKDDSQSKV